MLRNYRNSLPAWGYQRQGDFYSQQANDAAGAIRRELQQIDRDQYRFGHNGRPGGYQYYNNLRNSRTEAARSAMIQAQTAAANAYNNAAIQANADAYDRRMDLADNEQGRKNLQTEYDRQLAYDKMAQEERMNNRNYDSLDKLSASMGDFGVNQNISGIPEYDLYDNDKNRIGGSNRFFRQALLG